MRLPWVGCSLIEMHVPIKVTYFIPRSFQVPMNSPSLHLFGPRKSNSSWPLALGLGYTCVCAPTPFQPVDICSFVNKPISNYSNKKVSLVCQKPDWHAFKYIYFLVSFVAKKPYSPSNLGGGERRNKSPELGSKVKFSVADCSQGTLLGKSYPCKGTDKNSSKCS